MTAKPKKFSVALFKHPTQPMNKTYFGGSPEEVNYELSEQVQEKIRKSIERFIKKY